MIDKALQRRLLAEVKRHPDPHLAARTLVNVAVFSCLNSLGPVTTVDFLRDAADDLERYAFAGVVMQ